jgi:DNA modification methylase
LADNRLAEKGGGWDNELLKVELESIDFSAFENFSMDDLGFDMAEIDAILAQADTQNTDADAEPQIDKAAELAEKWGVKRGQLWQLGNHRILCGDSTNKEDVEKVMQGEKAELCHADPPYGMGKENEGVENDNLYVDKLDKFQMEWWKACRQSLKNNASAYIWGMAENLWRLWYAGGLKASERFTFRNEIVWDKGCCHGMNSSGLRMFPPATERCLFFMLGEQGFNINADNYWEGWEPIRAALVADCEKMGWTAKDVKRICGVDMFKHWCTKSQWAFIPEKQYEKLQAAAQGYAFKREHDAFKREYDELKREFDELKREFYKTRAYFDNSHETMTEVWSYPSVLSDERHGHSTPKPTPMICRAIKSSTDKAGTVYEPFSGSGTTLIACEQLGRKCRAIEISPDYVAVAIQRWADATGGEPKLAG